MILQNKTVLYHGSYMSVSHPDISKCMDGKDFGKGFYLTTDKKQAERFVNSAVGKAIKNGIVLDDPSAGYVSEYAFKSTERLKVYEFEDAGREWLHCVVAHRRNGLLSEELDKWKDYDVIVGKIANDNTNQVITAYMNGAYGTVGSESADAIAIQLLLPQKLTNQICLKNEKALSAISFIKAEKYAIKQSGR